MDYYSGLLCDVGLLLFICIAGMGLNALWYLVLAVIDVLWALRSFTQFYKIVVLLFGMERDRIVYLW
jgi:hypothetical protein